MNNYLKQIRNTFSKFFILLTLYTLGRVLFYLLNRGAFSDNSPLELAQIFIYGIRFDYAAIILLNLPFLLLYLPPFGFVNNRSYRRITDSAFLLINAGWLLLNLGDAEYFKYIGKRSTADLFSFIFMSNDVAVLLPQFIHDFWYIGVVWLVCIGSGIFVYRRFLHREPGPADFTLKSRLAALFIFILLSGLLFLGARGTGLKPIQIITAARYTRAHNIPLLINTPFSMYNTFTKRSTEAKPFFPEDTLPTVYSPDQAFTVTGTARKDNVVIVIMEGFSKEYIGALTNRAGYTPNLDRLIRDGLVFENAFANGKQSIVALPAILAGIPALMNDPYVSSSYSANNLAALPSILAARGYHTSFFHGGRNGTMGFDDFSHLAGIEHYFGKNEYDGPPAFDGKWGIFDEEFLQFYAGRLNSFPRPFFSAVFTLSSHHPYTVPERYRQKFSAAPNDLLKSIRYADYALGRFFETISKMPWYKQTLFVFVADHTAAEQSREYGTSAGMYRIPLLFYHPGVGDLKGTSKRVTQQADIFPSILDYLRISQPFTAFGTSVFDPAAHGFATNYLGGVYQIIQDDYLLSFDGEKSIALYNMKQDLLLTDNLLGRQHAISADMEQRLKGIIQQFDTRMKRNMLTNRRKSTGAAMTP